MKDYPIIVDQDASTIPAPPKKKPKVPTLNQQINRFGIPARINTLGIVCPNKDWERKCIVALRVPWPNLEGFRAIRVHRDAADKFQLLFQRWDQAGLLRLLLSFDGGFVCRMKRGREGSKDLADLSNHSWGTAIDVNAKWNQRGTPGARMGDIGCVEPLAPIAEECGFVWGDSFTTKDRMHFELGA